MIAPPVLVAPPEPLPVIHTPEHRLRVFISSTLGELAAERDSVKAAVKTLRLSPVMFELGARPHPPRDLYRSYLAQSEIFVGIYWQSYGWVAPDMTISGIEDEYALSADRPRLIYVKEPAHNRDPRLAQLLDRIRADGMTSYKRFESPGELAELFLDDLALVMSERFEASRAAAPLPSGTLTFMFSDIEGSTPLLERLDGRYADVLHRYHAVVRGALAAHQGTVVDTEGDGIFGVFTEADSAVEAAVEIQRTLAAGPLAHDAQVRVRIGLHTGHATPTGEGYVGLDVHRAARISATGHGGQIVVSSTVHEILADAAARHRWQVRDLGSYSLKGLSRAERLYQLTAPGLAAEFAEPKARRSSQVRLPGQLTSLVDRERERADLTSLLTVEQARLVTLTGAGGIGKTRLALAVADQVSAEYPDGVYFVNLAPVSDAGQVLGKIAEAAGVTTAGSVLESLTDALAHQKVLLVIDNFEQVVADAPAVAELLGRCPGLHALVTSRVALRVSGEHEYRVGPLAVPPDGWRDPSDIGETAAVQLFAERARAVLPSFALTDANAATIAAICRRLDGLPLAIELAAARLRLLTPQALLTQLARSLDALGRGPTDGPARQRTLRSTIDWSYDLLTAEEQAVLRRVSVLAGPWTFDTAEQLAHDVTPDVFAAVESLVDKSLVRADVAAGGEPRFRLLATIREYAAERLRESGEDAAVRDRHAAHFTAFAEATAPLHRGPDHVTAMARFDEEWEDLREAAGWLTARQDAHSLVRLTHSLWRYVWLRGHLPDSREWVDAAFTAVDGLPPMLRGRLCFLAGGLAFEAGEYPRALELFDRAIELFERLEDNDGLAWAHYIRAATLPAFGTDAGVIEPELFDALERFRATGDLWGQSWALTNLGMLAAARGDVDRAVAHHTECRDLAARLDDPSMLAQAHTQLGFTFLSSGRVEEARASLARAVAIHRRSSFREGLSYCLDALAGLALQDGHAERAMIALGAAEGIRQRLGLRPWPAVKWYLDFLGSAADAVQDDDLQASRAAGREMEPLSAAAFALGEA